MPPSLSRQWFRLHASQHSITPCQSNSKFYSRQHARFHQLRKMEIAFVTFESARILSLGYRARSCLRRKAWTVCEPKRSSECYQKPMAWCLRSDDQGSYIAVEKAFSRSGKADWRTNLAHFLLISWLMITVMFWCSLCTSENLNDELLANTVLWLVTLLCLYHG